MTIGRSSRSSVLGVLLGCTALLAPVQSAAAAEHAAAAPTQREAESMQLPSTAGGSYSDAGASAGAALLIWSEATATTSLTAPAGGHLTISARGDLCNGAPQVSVSVDGQHAGTVTVGSSAWQDYVVPGSWPDGEHQVAVTFTNDSWGGNCDRNVRLDTLEVTPTGSGGGEPATGNPFSGATGYVDPDSEAKRAADARRSWDPAGAAALDKVASGPTADWFGDWIPASSLAGSVSDRVTRETAAGALPVLVTYAIPHRDCGGYSDGGVPDATAYRAWIGALKAGIAGRRAVVVLEPDALPQLDCLSGADQSERLSLLSDAVSTLSEADATSVYLDGGSPSWIAADLMATRLRAAGVAGARGFSLNVSNFSTDQDNDRYGDTVSGLTGGKHFVVDTSRNGRGPGDTWCNPVGRGLGRRFTAATGDANADAYTWLKIPGQSDGTCNGGPPAGTFWTDYAIGLGSRASF